MRNGLKFVPAIANILLLSLFALPLTTVAVLSADQPTVSIKLAKPLKAAQDAMAAKNYDEAMAKIKEAQAVPEKTPYDNWVINTFLLKVYAAKQDMASEVPVIENLAQSQYTTPDQKKIYLKSVAQYYYQTKDYNKALETANEAVKAGASDSDVMGLIARSQYLTGKYKEAAATMQEIVGKQEKPDEDSLKLLWQFCDKAGDKAGAAKAVEKLVAYYPKPEYWANALASLANADTKDGHLQLNVYRLMLDVGVLKRGIDYSDMAELSLDQGYPGETQSVLQKAFGENVFTEQRDKDRYQHLLDGAKQRAASDLASLPKQEQDAAAAPQGDKLVQVGAAYMSYGQNDKAIGDIQKGIAKGSLKYPDEANLLLGIAQLRSHNAAEAQRSFEKVSASTNPGYARLGKLWALHAGAKSV
jgi:tetratricopeptide (TPR) repeat protein